MEPDDLIQEALTRAIDTRTCPVHVDVVKFLAEAIHSIASGEAAKKANRIPMVAVAKTGSQETAVENAKDPGPNAEDRLLQTAENEGIKADVLALFVDDKVANDIVEGLFLGYTAEDLKQLTGLNQTGYERSAD